MVRRLLLAVSTVIVGCFMMSAQENQVKRLPGVSHVAADKSYDDLSTGLWMSVEAQAAIPAGCFIPISDMARLISQSVIDSASFSKSASVSVDGIILTMKGYVMMISVGHFLCS